MNRQQGFTLIELMVVIGIIAILSAIGVPAYQNYLRKRRSPICCKRSSPTAPPLSFAPRIVVVWIAATQAPMASLPDNHTLRFSDERGEGIVSLTGQESLNGLEVLMTPIWSDGNGMTGWTRDCKIASDTALRQACEDVFRFDNN